MPCPEPIAARGKPPSEPLAVMLRREAALQVLHIAGLPSRLKAYGRQQQPGARIPGCCWGGSMRRLLQTPIRWEPTPNAAWFAKAVSVAGKRRNRDMNRLDRVLQRKGGFLNRQIAGLRRDDAVSGRTLPDFGRQSQPGIAVTTFGIEQAGF